MQLLQVPSMEWGNVTGCCIAAKEDNGDMNYKRYRIINASNRLSSDMTVKYGD